MIDKLNMCAVAVVSTFCISNPVLGESRLCIPLAGVALVESVKTGDFEPIIVDVDEFKFIHSNESGEWKAKRFGHSYYMYDDCGEGNNHCVASGGWSGFFNFNLKVNSFTASFLWGEPSESGAPSELHNVLVGGKCSKI